jgi:hypothetical protein
VIFCLANNISAKIGKAQNSLIRDLAKVSKTCRKQNFASSEAAQRVAVKTAGHSAREMTL